MRVLTVDMFIEQNKRAAEHARKAQEDINDGKDAEVSDVVELMRNSVQDFFPTMQPLPEMT